MEVSNELEWLDPLERDFTGNLCVLVVWLNGKYFRGLKYSYLIKVHGHNMVVHCCRSEKTLSEIQAIVSQLLDHSRTSGNSTLLIAFQCNVIHKMPQKHRSLLDFSCNPKSTEWIISAICSINFCLVSCRTSHHKHQRGAPHEEHRPTCTCNCAS